MGGMAAGTLTGYFVGADNEERGIGALAGSLAVPAQHLLENMVLPFKDWMKGKMTKAWKANNTIPVAGFADVLDADTDAVENVVEQAELMGDVAQTATNMAKQG